ncbi:MAG: helix-turn-helix transcriptional regulator [Clostridia bacterium]|nr:helix-turn-helix transcriptional regulator [Clostridia bacterium]
MRDKKQTKATAALCNLYITKLCGVNCNNAKLTVPDNCHLIFYQNDGEAAFNFGGRVTRIGRNFVIYIPSGTNFSANLKASKKNTVIYFTSDGKPFNETVVTDCSVNPYINTLFVNALKFFNSTAPSDFYRSVSDTYKILSYLHERRIAEQEDCPIILKKALDYVQQNVGTNVSELAMFLEISGTHIRKLFNTYMGCSPREYIEKTRLELAAELLSKKSHSIKKISEICGYTNEKVFSIAFKRYFGIPPKKYTSSF